MAVTIRLSRIGKKHVPFYRLIAVDSRKKRDGKFLDNIGTYDQLKGSIVRFDEECYNKWVARGAVVSDSAKKVYRLYKKLGSTEQTPAEPVTSSPSNDTSSVEQQG